MEQPPARSFSPPRRAERALQLTDRDRQLIAFAAEHRFVLTAHLGRLVGSSAPSVGRRLSQLRGAGLVSGERPLSHDATAWAITRRGLAVLGSGHSPPRPVDLATYRHEVGVAWLAVAAHRGIFGEIAEVVGERRMRSEDGRGERPTGTPTHGVALPPAGEPGRRLHYPDLTLVTGSGHHVAFELELSTKSPRRRERILAAYASERRVDAVVYLVPTQAAANAITRSAARVGAQEKVQVQRFRWAGDRAPGEPARGASRSPPAGRTAAER